MRHSALVAIVATGIFSASSGYAQTFIVSRGDTFSSIALRELGSADRWPDLCYENRDLISDCDVLPTGATLRLPGSMIASEVQNHGADVETFSPSSVRVALVCEALGRSENFMRSVDLDLQGTTLSFLKGTVGARGYEQWEGLIDADGAVEIAGEYIEGSFEVKSVQFTGNFSAGELNASGTRGPRACTLEPR